MINMVGPSGKWAGIDEAIAAEKKALELDPLNSLFNTDLALFLLLGAPLRRRDRANSQNFGIGS